MYPVAVVLTLLHEAFTSPIMDSNGQYYKPDCPKAEYFTIATELTHKTENPPNVQVLLVAWP